MSKTDINEVQGYTLGLDIGIASVGAAVLGSDRIEGLYVRTFDKAETDKEGEPLNKIRREARSTRRRLQRRAHRLLRLRRLFKREGLLPSAQPELLKTCISPWQLRAEGLDRLLGNTEWAAVLHHLVKHRGFQSTRKSERQEDEKVGQMLAGVGRNQKLMQEGGYRTVGEMAACHPEFSQAKRNKGGSYTNTFARADLEHELQRLFASQRQHGNAFASSELEERVHQLLMQRRPALSGDDLMKMVGRCTFEPQEFRAPKASHSAERFVWLTRLNNLRLNNLGQIRELAPEEREQLIDLPFRQAKLTYKQVRSKLELPDSTKFVGLLYSGRDAKDPEGATLFEAKAFHVLRKAYEKAGLKTEWARDSQNPQRLNQIAYALTAYKEDDEATAYLKKHGLEDAIISALLFESFSEFVRLSVKAIDKILPFMQEGKRYDEAVILAGYAHHSQLAASAKSDRIPRFSRDFVTNPVVSRALNQARKVVNAIIQKHGMPQAIHIELARDLSRNFKERKEIEREQLKFRNTKQEDISRFEQEFGFTPRGVDFLKWRLYREQDAKCAYSLMPLDTHRLFEPGYTEIDHALPYSRSFNDGLSNKVLVLTKENRDKGNQTPFEYLGGAQESERWRAFAAWVSSNHKFRDAKKRNLLRRDFGQEAMEEFKERNLNDTRYITRAFKQLVEAHLPLPKGGCVTVSGQLTAFLRTRWGLLKVREDGDKHHALDAAVVAACSRSLVKRLSDYSKRGELEQVRSNYTDPVTGEIIDVMALRKLEERFPQPWEGFREELIGRLSDTPVHYLERLSHYTAEQAQQVEPIRVSRAPTRRGLGQAHQETIRSAKHLEQGLSAVRTPLQNLKIKDLENMVGYDDPRNQSFIAALRERLEKFGDDGKKAFAEPFYKPTKSGLPGPEVRAVKLFAVQKSGLPVREGIAANGDMLRIDVFSKNNRYFVVPLYVADVVKPELPSRAVVAGKPEEEWDEMDDSYQFLFSLYPNDWIEIELKNKTWCGYYAGLDRSTGAVHIWSHDRNQEVGSKGLIRSIGIKTAKNVRKYHVDILGRAHLAKPEVRKPLA